MRLWVNGKDTLSGLFRHLMYFSPIYFPTVCFNLLIYYYEVIKLRFRCTALGLMETGILLVSPTIWSTKNSRGLVFISFVFIGVFRPGKDLWLKATARFNQERDSVDSPDQFQMAPRSKTMPWCLPNARVWVISKKNKNRCVIMNGCFTGGDALRDFN